MDEYGRSLDQMAQPSSINPEVMAYLETKRPAKPAAGQQPAAPKGLGTSDALKEKAAMRAPTQDAADPAAQAPEPKKYGFTGDLSDEALVEAQENRDASQLFNNIGRGATTISSALGRIKNDTSFYDNLDKQAAQGISDIQERRKGQSEEMALAEKQRIADPTSPENQAFRAWIEAEAPEVAKGIDFNNLAAAGPTIQKLMEVHLQNKSRKVAAEANRLQRDLVAATNRSRDLERQQRFEDDRVKAYTDNLQKSGLSELAEAVIRTDRAIGGLDSTSDVPGVGAGAFVPGQMLDNKGRDARQEVAALRNVILKARSGGAVTEPEADRFLQELGSGMGQTDAQLRTGLRIIRDQVASKLRDAQMGLRPELLDVYRQRGGKTTYDDFMKNWQSKPSSSSEGRTVVKKLFSPSRNQTKITYSDGTSEILDGQQ
jgi:hypothetical protein